MKEMILVSGFLGAGKTTLIRHILGFMESGKRLALLENEFGECSVDDLLLRRPGLILRALSAGCICCSLASSFRQTVEELVESEEPDCLLIEPSGVAGMSDLLSACGRLPEEWGFSQALAITVVDAEMHTAYVEQMGEFYLDQIRHAGVLVCSKLDLVSMGQARAVGDALAKENPEAAIFACPWEELDVTMLLEAARERAVLLEHGHDHHHHHHHHHHSGALFTSLTLHPDRPRSAAEWEDMLAKLSGPEMGRVLRAKGFLPGAEGNWYQVDYTPGRVYLHSGAPLQDSVLVVIGTDLNQEAIVQCLEE